MNAPHAPWLIDRYPPRWLLGFTEFQRLFIDSNQILLGFRGVLWSDSSNYQWEMDRNGFRHRN